MVFYAPKVNKELIEFQSEFCQGVSEFGELAWDLYHPGNWTPHIIKSCADGEVVLKLEI